MTPINYQRKPRIKKPIDHPQKPQGATKKHIINQGNLETRNKKLLSPKAGYNQHTSPIRRIFNTHIMMLKAKSCKF